MEPDELDKCYEEAAKFDAANLDKHIRDNFDVLCRRTEYPKLGYIIDRLNKLEIPCLLHGESFHAPILWVDKKHSKQAAEILEERHGRYRLDDVRDDNPKFIEFKDVKPEPVEEDWTGDPSRDSSVPGDR